MNYRRKSVMYRSLAALYINQYLTYLRCLLEAIFLQIIIAAKRFSAWLKNLSEYVPVLVACSKMRCSWRAEFSGRIAALASPAICQLFGCTFSSSSAVARSRTPRSRASHADKSDLYNTLLAENTEPFEEENESGMQESIAWKSAQIIAKECKGTGSYGRTARVISFSLFLLLFYQSGPPLNFIPNL